MNIKTVCLAFFLATTTGTVAAIAAVESPATLASAANENCEHVGNHYSRVSPTKETNGVKEYWVCCSCREHYLTKPSIGEWTDKVGTAMELPSSDDRYLAALNTPEAIAAECRELGFTATVTKDGGVEISSYTGSEEIISIPEGVTSILKGTFANKTVVNIVIPASVTTLSSQSFSSTTKKNLFFVGDTKYTTNNFTGVQNIYKIQGKGWDYVNGEPTPFN